MSQILPILVLSAGAVGLVRFQAPEARAPVIQGLDHIPIAVNDLERAADRYRELGFALKPGRPHEDGIRNQHVKFRDGTELELITAPAATDALTTTYRRHLAQGDGPAFLALFAPSREQAERRLASTPLPAYMFLSGRNLSPTDRPEHFAHPNTAESFIAVWLAGADFSKERQLLESAGATFTHEAVHVPEAVTATVAHLPEGEVVFLPASYQLVRGRLIVGATLRVRSVATARRLIERVPKAGLVSVAQGTSSLFLPPSLTQGLWLELRQAS
jgi:catechol 2,3-dioxygenase-like lactoylglutathione lyase family enzyme